MDLQPAIIVNETKVPEFIHEDIDATARRRVFALNLLATSTWRPAFLPCPALFISLV
jgi:hypothetical protein